MGCTTAGEILNREVLHEQVVISFLVFEKTHIDIAFTQNETEEDTVEWISDKIIRSNSKGMLLLPVVLNTRFNIDRFIKELYKKHPLLPVFGGGAGDNSVFDKQYVFYNDGVYDSGMVAATFNSDVLEIRTDYSFNWKPVGNVLTLTKTDKFAVYEIDHRPALDVIGEYLGEDAVNELPQSGIEYPLVFNHDDVSVARVIVGIRDKALIMSSPVEENSKFQFSFGLREKAIEHAGNLARSLAQERVEYIMAFSCIARLNFFKDDAAREIVNFAEIAPVSGFFTYGEILHISGKDNYFMNETLTLAYFWENRGPVNIKSRKIESKQELLFDKEDRILKVLTHLISKVTRELEAKNRELNNAYSILLDYNRIIDDKSFEIRKSLRYASSLQQIIMDNILDFANAFEDYFLFFQPKDIVSGDFYFVKDLEDRVVLAVADATGHGVPGAFISILGMRMMEEITDHMHGKYKDIDAGDFLNILRDKMKMVFRSNMLNRYASDGLDISVVIIDKDRYQLNFASANQTGLLISQGEIIQLKGDSMPIGVFIKEDAFTNLNMIYKNGDSLILFTDGYMDQFGGKKNKKLNFPRFRNIILENSDKDFNMMEVALDDFLSKWKGDNEQTDDILVLGVRF